MHSAIWYRLMQKKKKKKIIQIDFRSALDIFCDCPYFLSIPGHRKEQQLFDASIKTRQYATVVNHTIT